MLAGSALEHDTNNERIINGYAATDGQFPYQVLLRIERDRSADWCGGSLIAAHWVLSAAHCTLRTPRVTMRFGSTQFNGGGIATSSTRIINHPQFNPTNLNNDISLVHVPARLPLGEFIQTIRLPARHQQSATFAGVVSTASGWGQTANGGMVQARLRYANLRVITNAECSRAFPRGGLIVASVLCTRGIRGVQGVCGGDSGGPLTIREGGIATQIGVTAFTALPEQGGCTGPHPHGFMRTASFLTWIHQQSGIPIRN